MTKVAIMQPTFLPWLGYFALMKSVDIFILLDSVQFARRSWQQRNQIKTTKGPLWLTVPVLSKGKREQLIYEVEIDNSNNFTESHQKTIELNYKKSQYFHNFSEDFFSIFNAKQSNLSSFNIELILWIRNQLGIDTQLLRSSNLKHNGQKADLLLSLCRQVNATEYISPLGSKNYLEDSDIFLNAGLPYHYFNYEHPLYSQQYGAFEPYMSTIDLLFNCGPESKEILLGGILD